MMKLLLSSSMDAVLAATRVFGNLSQSKDVRSVIMQTKGERDTRCSSQVLPRKNQMGASCSAQCGVHRCKLLCYVWAELIRKASCNQRKHARVLWLYQPDYLCPPRAIILFYTFSQHTGLW